MGPAEFKGASQCQRQCCAAPPLRFLFMTRGGVKRFKENVHDEKTMHGFQCSWQQNKLIFQFHFPETLEVPHTCSLPQRPNPHFWCHPGLLQLVSPVSERGRDHALVAQRDPGTFPQTRAALEWEAWRTLRGGREASAMLFLKGLRNQIGKRFCYPLLMKYKVQCIQAIHSLSFWLITTQG